MARRMTQGTPFLAAIWLTAAPSISTQSGAHLSSTHPDCEAQEKAIRAGDLDALCAAAGNALEECSGAKDNEAIKALLLSLIHI